MAQVPVAAVLCLVIGGPYMYLGYEHFSRAGRVDLGVQSVLLFLSINVVICLWELCLCYKYELIRSTHAKRVKDGQTHSATVVVFRWMSVSELLSPSFWSHIWIDYARYDPAYANSLSFGYNVDVGNGHSTLAPTIFLMVSIIWPLAGAKVTGMVGLIVHYQMLYGTLVYYFCFFNTKSSTGPTSTKVVFGASLPWVVCPLVGMFHSYRLIMDEDFSVWR